MWVLELEPSFTGRPANLLVVELCDPPPPGPLANPPEPAVEPTGSRKTQKITVGIPNRTWSRIKCAERQVNPRLSQRP